MLPEVSFCLRIDASPEVRFFLPQKRDEFLKRKSPLQEEIVIHVEKKAIPEEHFFPDGWNVCFLNGSKSVVYACGGEVQFSIGLSPLMNDITVRVNRVEYTKISVLYGMMLALYRNCIGLHGVTLLLGGQTVILSAPSGTGKTTLALLLQKYCDAIIINGDFALLSLHETCAVFEPTPFCGTSGVCLNKRVKVDRIVFLSQSKQNIWTDIDGREAICKLMSNSFVPSFDKQLNMTVQLGIIQLLSLVRTNCFAFEPTKEAAEMLHDKIADERTGNITKRRK